MRWLLTFLLLCLPVRACEILVKARDWTVQDAEDDRRGSWKRGMMVTVKPDGHVWGAEEGLPRFVIIKIPLISVARAEKYLAHQMETVEGVERIYRRRLWQLRWADLPLSARNKLANNGQLVIKATAAYTGTSDYTWAQVKQYFRNLETNADETEDL